MRFTELRLPSLLLCAATSVVACGGSGGGATDSDDVPFNDPTEGDPTEGDPTEGDPSEGDTSEGDTSEGDTSEGDTASGDTAGGDTGGGDTTGDDPTIIGVTNHESVVESLAEVTSLRRLDALVDRIPLLDLAYPPIDDAPSSHPGLVPTDSDFDTQDFGFDCVNGGTYRVRTVETFTDRIEMRNCDLDGTSLTGNVLHLYAPGLSDDTYESLQATSSDGVTEMLDGRREQVRTDRDSVPRSLSWDVEEYVRSGGEGALTVRDALTEVEVGPTFGGSQSAERRFDSTMSVTADWTGEQPMTITTPVPFGDFADAGRYRVGTLRAVAADGSALDMVADNGDPDSFTVDVTAAGVTTAFTVPWIESNRLRCFAPAGELESLYGCD